MAPESAGPDPQRILVVLPNWVGDAVLATPVLAALRARFREARITYLLRRYVAEIVEGGGWHDDELFWEPAPGRRPRPGLLHLAGRIRAAQVDLALLLTNSFRSALAVWLGRARRRTGYARDARGWMLTDALRPARRDGAFVPMPMLDYYIALARRVGCPVTDRRLRLGISPRQEQAGRELQRRYGLEGRAYAVINPGAAYGEAKCWLPQRFAEVCRWLATRAGLVCVLVGSPGEAALLRRICDQAGCPGVLCCDDPPTTLGSLKVLVRDARLLVCNDTGPRHYGNAFRVPTVTLFGPTFQEWTDTGYEGEIKLQVPVPCGPCMLRTCPIDHRCMTGLTTEMVLRAIDHLLENAAHRGTPRSPGGPSAVCAT